jgi:hypothetical protein
MFRPSESRSRRWNAGQPREGWSDNERPYAALLDALSRELSEVQATEVELDAGARREMADILDEEQRIEQEQRAEARDELAAFREALDDLRARGGPDGAGEVPYDSANPRQDELADVLIQFLVRPGYAEVRTEEPSPGRRVYLLTVAWDRLRALAESVGYPLGG